MSDTIVVNLFGVPGAGKSSGAAYIFAKLKMLGVNAELVTEFAKDKVYEEDKGVFENQLYIFGKQYFRMSRINGKVEVLITDSPLLNSVFYNTDTLLGEEFKALVSKVFQSFDSINYLVLRNKPYNPSGRFQTEEESDALVEPLKNLLNSEEITYSMINGDLDGYDAVINNVMNRLKGEK